SLQEINVLDTPDARAQAFQTASDGLKGLPKVMSRYGQEELFEARLRMRLFCAMRLQKSPGRQRKVVDALEHGGSRSRFGRFPMGMSVTDQRDDCEFNVVRSCKGTRTLQ